MYNSLADILANAGNDNDAINQVNSIQLFPDYLRHVVPFFGGHEEAQRAFAEYLVTGDHFDIPAEWGVNSFSLVERYGNMGVINALLLAEMVRKGRGKVKVARKTKGK